MKTRLTSFLLRYLIIGVAIGWGLLALIFAFDLGGIRTLITKSDNTVLAIMLLMVGFAITFGNAVMGIALVKMPYDKPGDDKQKIGHEEE